MKWSTGILGINARNILYIKPFNKKKAIRLADNKLESKQFFYQHKIPTATVYKVIHNKKELETFQFDEIAAKSFVIKPNRGFGGEGIKIVTDKKSISPQKARELKNHIANILDGNFSLTNAPDIAILEQRIICHPDLSTFSYQGLPDIRVIVHNLIPVMAMIRFPTKESDGKANYHAGGAIAGIDLASGKITRVVIRDKSVKLLPYCDISPIGFTIPAWDQILLIASQAQLYSNIGYLAIDIVLNKKGTPMVLEMNARGGLSIQVANKAKLRERLDRIQGLKVKTPERGVRLGKEIFGKQQTTEMIETEIEHLSGKEILGSFEPVALLAKNGKQERTIAVLDTNKIYTSIDRALAIRLGIIDKDYEAKEKVEFFSLKLQLGKRKVRTFVTIRDYSDQTYKVAIGRRNLRKVFIDPFKGLPGHFLQAPAQVSTSFEQEKEADQLLGELYNNLSFLYHLQPINLAEERKKWLADSTYCPQFHYQKVSELYESALKELEAIPQFDSDIGMLIKSRAEEIARQIQLLKAIGSKEFLAIARTVFRPLSSEELERAQTYVQNVAKLSRDEKEVVLDAEHIQDVFQQILTTYGITDWKCKISEHQFASIRIRKNNQIAIPRNKAIPQNRLIRLIAHELLTHILSRHNAEKQHWHLYSYGFPGYIYTQEGIALFNEAQSVNIPHEQLIRKSAQNALLLYEADMRTGQEFSQLLLRDRKPNDAWRSFVRIKRGLANTAEKGGLGRENVYFLGSLPLIGANVIPPILYAGRVAIEHVNVANKYNSLETFATPQFPIII
ncbi:MAG: DUF1704 domain-containing protein [Candidatus Abawacabacteria bacterium]|nr:DUF1704 domain-containing protein [Candidatus Abawacabacteria bacterium]